MKKYPPPPHEYPSEFKVPKSIPDMELIFEAFNFDCARMLGGSKAMYRRNRPDDLIVFNANVIMPGFGKIWYGDLNLTEDYLTLQKIAECLNTTLYILWEMDARFGTEMESIADLIKKAIWNTNEDKPTAEWYKKKTK